MLRKFFYTTFLLFSTQVVIANSPIEIKPDVGMGPILFSMNLNAIKNLGFNPIVDAHKTSILQKDNLLIILENEKVKSISYVGKDTSKLILNGKVLPKKNDPMSLKSFFKNCANEIKGSGGIIIPCENNKIEIIYNYLNQKLDLEFDSISLKNIKK